MIVGDKRTVHVVVRIMVRIVVRVVVGDVELGLNTTRSNELGDLEGVGVSGGEHTRQYEGLGPKTKS